MALCIFKVGNEHYNGDGLRSFGLRAYELVNGEKIYAELLPGRVEIKLIGPDNEISYEWDSDGTGGITLEDGGVRGLISFNKINSWNMAPGAHVGKIVHYALDGFKTTLREIRFDFI